MKKALYMTLLLGAACLLGGLIGGASLVAEKFTAIVNAASAK